MTQEPAATRPAAGLATGATDPAIGLAAPLNAAVVARLAHLRLSTEARVTGTRDGGHRSTRHGSSLEFADQRPYVTGDDPRTLDLAASRRHGRLLVRVHEAEDDTSLRVVVDASASMAFGHKLRSAAHIALALAHVAAHGGDRLRVLVATTGQHVTAGPWVRGRNAPLVVAHTLADVATVVPDPDGHPGPAPLLAALARARGEGPRGPIVLVSDMLVVNWTEVVRLLGTGSQDAVLVHLLGREDAEPDLTGDLELVDAETGDTVSIAATDDVMAQHRHAMQAWQAEVAATAARYGVAVVSTHDDDPVDRVVTVGLRGVGLVA